MYKTNKITIALFLMFFASQNLFAVTNYVSKTGGHVSPFYSWENAATNIQAAVDVASSGDTVLVNDGTYYPGSQIIIAKNITVKSVNGAEKTIVDGSNTNRCFYLQSDYPYTANPTIDGFTITNGYSDNGGREEQGGGVMCYYGGKVQNCVISGNLAHNGGGVYCYYGGTVQNCAIIGNSAHNGGGVYCYYDGTVQHCNISENSAEYGGGGVYCSINGTVQNCTISSNSAIYGGGVHHYYGDTIQNCIIIGNSATIGGGLACLYSGTVQNCIINNNSASLGGGVWCYKGGIVQNCTITYNLASNDGGVSFDSGGEITNSIVYFNNATNNPNYNDSSRLSYSCSPGLVGNGNIAGNPLFADANAANYRLKSGSACINTGTNMSWMINAIDLDSLPRIYDGIVDMGAYEYQIPKAPAYINASDGDYLDRIAVNWATATGATRYIVYRNTIDTTNDIVNVSGNISDTNYNDITVLPGHTYYYWIRSGNSYGLSDFAGSDSGYAMLSSPTNIVATDGEFTDKVEIIWPEVSGANSYSVYRNTTNTSVGMILIGTTDNTTKTDVSAIAGQYYYYWVKAIAPACESTMSESDRGNVKVSAPGNISATDGIYSNKVDVTWNDVTGAVMYVIYRNTSSNNSTATQIGTTMTSSYEDVQINPGQLYYYWIAAVSVIDTSDLSDSDSGYAKLMQPTNIFATDGDYNNKVDITWSNVPYALAYNIYRGETNETAIATLLGTSSSNVYFDTTVIPGVKYYYWIKATAVVGNSELSNRDSGYAKLTQPTNISATDGDYNDKVVVTWSNVFGATTYNVYRGGTNDVLSATFLGTLTSNIYSDTTVIPGVKYYYWIKATADIGNSELSDSDSGYAKLISPTNIFATDGDYNYKIDITWSNVPYALAYNIYRGETNDAVIATLLGTSSSNIYSDTTVIPGKKYYYWIRATADVGNSELSENDSGYAILLLPANISATDGAYNDKVIVTWSNVFGATNYSVYRSETDNAINAIIIGAVTNNSYIDTSVVASTLYYYWIGATAEIGDSDLSDSDSGFAFASQGEPETQGKWKYKSKNGKAKLKVKGIGLDMPLSNYLEDGCLVGLKDASTDKTVDGPRALTPEKKKNGDIKFWFYNEKKVAIIKYKPNDEKPEKDKLSYKVWKELPTEIIFFVQPFVGDAGDSNAPAIFVEPVYELYLSPGEKMKNGWWELKSEQ